jgi:Etoposide-induced protein 2.4 (EI24)
MPPRFDGAPMNDLMRAFVRAVASMLHPRMLWLTFMPFLVAAAGWGVFFWFAWQNLVDAVRGWLAGSAFGTTLYHAFDWVGFALVHAAVAPFIVIVLAIPFIVVTVLLLIATISMPLVVRHLSTRFAALEVRRGGTWYGSLVYALATTFVCLALIVVTLPLWLIPPLFAVIPPLLWGWLTYRVMTYDALALHASRAERIALMRRHRWSLLAIGVASGLMSTLPTLIWAWSIWLIVLFPVITAATIWIYAAILVFSALWFGHYCLHALQRMRDEEGKDGPHDLLPPSPSSTTMSNPYST